MPLIQRPKGHEWSPPKRGSVPAPGALPPRTVAPQGLTAPRLPCSAVSSPSELSLASGLWPPGLISPCLSYSPLRDTVAGWGGGPAAKAGQSQCILDNHAKPPAQDPQPAIQVIFLAREIQIHYMHSLPSEHPQQGSLLGPRRSICNTPIS